MVRYFWMYNDRKIIENQVCNESELFLAVPWLHDATPNNAAYNPGLTPNTSYYTL